MLAQAQAFRQTETLVLPDNGWQAMLVLSIPLFDGGVRYGIARERRAVDEQARLTLDGLLRQVSVEVRAAMDDRSRRRRGPRGGARRRRGRDDAAVLADKSYRAGASTNLEVVDAERVARDAGSRVALAEDAARQARLDLLLATGAFP